MGFIRTVLGDIASDALGICYAHEHLIIDSSYATTSEPDFLLDSVESGVAELSELKALGVGACIDSMPMDCGRNVTKLAAISRGTGVHIVAPTGLHLAKYYAPAQRTARQNLEVESLQRIFEAEIKDGIEATGVKAGVIKVAALQEWDATTQTIFRAAAGAQIATGAPILTHTEEGRLALEQAQFLADHGADLNHVVLSHLDRNPDPDYHRTVLATGVSVEYDSHFRWKNRPDNPTLDLLQTLLPEFPDQIVLGMDAARRSYWKSYGGGPGLAYLITTFRDRMQAAGIEEALMQRVFVSTPARVYSLSSQRPSR